MRWSLCVLWRHTKKITKVQIVADYPDVFKKGLGHFPWEYAIEVDGATVPLVQNRPRRLPHTMKQVVESKLLETE